MEPAKGTLAGFAVQAHFEAVLGSGQREKAHNPAFHTMDLPWKYTAPWGYALVEKMKGGRGLSLQASHKSRCIIVIRGYHINPRVDYNAKLRLNLSSSFSRMRRIALIAPSYVLMQFICRQIECLFSFSLSCATQHTMLPGDRCLL